MSYADRKRRPGSISSRTTTAVRNMLCIVGNIAFKVPQSESANMASGLSSVVLASLAQQLLTTWPQRVSLPRLWSVPLWRALPQVTQPYLALLQPCLHCIALSLQAAFSAQHIMAIVQSHGCLCAIYTAHTYVLTQSIQTQPPASGVCLEQACCKPSLS